MSPKRSFHDLTHDMRNPLSVIRMTAETGLLEPDLSPSLREVLTDIIRQVDTVSEIANAISMKASMIES